MLDYGALADKPGFPVLVVPSLINRSYILDLTTRRSFLRYLAKRRLRPLLVDWGTPDDSDLQRSLDDYIIGKLMGALQTANAVAGDRRVPVIGYCMGGTLATALTILADNRVSALAVLATPWDFHAPCGESSSVVRLCCTMLERFASVQGCLPAEALQAVFFCVDPTLSWTKFRRFGLTSPESREAELFVAVEDWVNDGVALSGPVARTCLSDWYVRNLPAQGKWTVGGQTIDPRKIDIPALVVIPARDRIVPPEAAVSLADRIPHARRFIPPAGHIGMMVGNRMTDRLWRPLQTWIHVHK